MADERQARDRLLRERACSRLRREAQEADQRCEKMALMEPPATIPLQPELIFVDQRRIDVTELFHRQAIYIKEGPELAQLLDLPPYRTRDGAGTHSTHIFLEQHRYLASQSRAGPVAQVYQHLTAVIASNREPARVEHRCGRAGRRRSFREPRIVSALHAALSGARSSPH